MTHQSFKCIVAIVHKIIIKDHSSRLKQEQDGAAAELEVSKLLCTLNLVALVAGDNSAAHHHSTHADDHDTAMSLAVNGDKNSHVLSVHIQS
ncbi:hypothetical protein HG531_008041 [Fusarium graminearum]|nr:hypothetical protein HG531_008041 [Fusarium graminearum]